MNKTNNFPLYIFVVLFITWVKNDALCYYFPLQHKFDLVRKLNERDKLDDKLSDETTAFRRKQIIAKMLLTTSMLVLLLNYAVYLISVQFSAFYVIS